MEINYYSSEPEKIDFNISEFTTKIEVMQRIEELFANKNQLSFLLKQPIDKELSIPGILKIVMNQKHLSTNVDIYLANDKSIEMIKKHFPSDLNLKKTLSINGIELIITTGDITEHQSEAIVNASNPSLVLGSGVSGAMNIKAGNGLQAEMHKIARQQEIQNGDAVITASYDMQHTKYIIHSACVEGSKDTIVLSVANALELCDERGIKNVAFPALGTGAGSMGMEDFTKIFLEEVKAYSQQNKKSLEQISLVLWSEEYYQTVISVL